MGTQRRESRLWEPARGVGLVVLLGAMICLAALVVIIGFVWALT
jgi:hypothetical protein